MNKQRYLENRECPYCGKIIEPMDLEDPCYISDDRAWSMQTGCPKCGHEWVEFFTLSNLKEIGQDEYISHGPKNEDIEIERKLKAIEKWQGGIKEMKNNRAKEVAEEICDYFVAKDIYAGRVTDTEPPVVELYGIDEEVIKITVDVEQCNKAV